MPSDTDPKAKDVTKRRAAFSRHKRLVEARKAHKQDDGRKPSGETKGAK